MKEVDLEDAARRLPELAEEAAAGAPFVITRDGVPIVRVEAVAPPQSSRIGFMKGEFLVPDDFDTMGAEEIAAMFEGGR